ncbi:MAG: GerAB/ArcD/ProY family transporter [Nanoarchaeota archaeon]|nr:GerAB/ArcD/ProY family transporter [Nanoarchaeota archaeon]
MFSKEGYKATATLVGTIIGAGVLGIPYVVAKAGFLTGMLVIILLGIVILLINLSIGEVVLRTKGVHQLTGYAEKYLGKKGKRIMTFSMFFGITGALLAYIIGVGEALGALFNLNPFWFSLGFFVIAAGLIYHGIKSVATSELLLSSLVITLILVIGFVCLFSGKMDINNLKDFNLFKIFVPYGVILFAFVGAAAVPEMSEIFRRNRKEFKKAIVIGSLIPLLLYAFFAFVIVGVFGKNVTEIATLGLGLEFGIIVVILANLFAVFSMSTSFLTLGLALREMYDYDYKLSHFSSWAITCFIPLILFLFGFKSFIKVLETSGVVAGGVEGSLIVLMLLMAKKKSERKPEYSIGINKIIGAVLIIVFVLGIILNFI